MGSSHLKWRIVLVRPRNPLNIGAAARALANFGFSDLVVVEPYTPAWQEARSAVGAERVIRNAEMVGALSEALDEVRLVVGTTAGQRRKLDRELLSLENLSHWLRQRQRFGKAALLFGSEKTGLSNEHLSYCHVVVRIPTVAECPSMNLGQAVAVCCYELARHKQLAPGTTLLRAEPVSAGGNTEVPSCSSEGESERPAAKPMPPRRTGVNSPTSPPASFQCLERVFERAVCVLDDVGYLKPKNRRAMIIKLRRLLVERGLSNYDARVLGGILAQIEWKLHR